jgi:two-component system, NtrC family, nitrogen regulation response regulator GlnG
MATGNILIADDDAAIRTVLSQALSRVGYDVRTTGDAATLWRWVQSSEGDLVITDFVMLDENAFELLPKMKKARSADRRHERARYLHNRDQGGRAPRL